jgi:uncharacterized protein (TIGR02246 family)
MSITLHEELINLIKDWEKAIVANDADAIAQYMADDWVLVTPEAGVIERGRFLDAIATGQLTHAAMQSDAVRVKTYDDVAVVTVRGSNSGAYLGEPFSADEWITDVMRNQDGRWRCVLTHLTPAKQ